MIIYAIFKEMSQNPKTNLSARSLELALRGTRRLKSWVISWGWRRSPNCECHICHQRSSLDPYGIYCKIDTDDTDRYRKIWKSERKSLYCNQGTSVSSGSIQSIRGCQYKVPHFSGSHKGYLAATAANLFETLNPWQETSCITVAERTLSMLRSYWYRTWSSLMTN